MHDELAAILAAAATGRRRGHAAQGRDPDDARRRRPRPAADGRPRPSGPPGGQVRGWRPCSRVSAIDANRRTLRIRPMTSSSTQAAKRAPRPGEHPDNPRRVEVHVEVKRHLWGWATDDDLTDDPLAGRPSWPGPRSSRRACRDPSTCSPTSRSTPRATCWSVAGGWSSGSTSGAVAPGVAESRRSPASRAWPTRPCVWRGGRCRGRWRRSLVDLGPLERAVPARLARWAAAVPLDARCGLTTGRPPDAPASVGARWERWRPDRWRLDVAYGDVPLPVALTRHGRTLIDRARRRG